MLRRLLPFLFAIILATQTSTSGTARAEEAAGPPTLFINLTSDDVWTQQMALGFAGRVAGLGYPVAIFLNVRAVGLAMTTVPQATQPLTGKTGQDVLKELMAKGVRVFLCPSCVRQAGYSIADRLEGVEPGSKATLDLMMADGTKVISY